MWMKTKIYIPATTAIISVMPSAKCTDSANSNHQKQKGTSSNPNYIK